MSYRCFSGLKRAADAFSRLSAAAHLLSAAAKVQKFKDVIVLLTDYCAIILNQRLMIEDPIFCGVAVVHGNMQAFGAALVELLDHPPPVFGDLGFDLLEY